MDLSRASSPGQGSLALAMHDKSDREIKTKLKDQQEKDFIKCVLGQYAVTASADRFEDCVVIDLEELCGVKGLPYLVYSIDHPSFVRRGLGDALDYRFYGRWVAAIVCGDVLAMGARPKGFALDLAVPVDMDDEPVKSIFQGLRDVLDAYGATFEGGNLDANALELVGYAWGIVSRDKIIRRAGARVGDYVVATGMLGFGWADWILRKLGRFNALSAQAQESFRGYKLMPLAPHQAMLEAVENGGITSGMDLSDGLIEFLYTILERSGLGVRLEETLFPVAPEMEQAAEILNVRPTLLTLEAGYDTPLTHGWTVAPEAWPNIQRVFQKYGKSVYHLGYVTEEPQVLLETSKGPKAIECFWDDQFRKDSVIDRWFQMVRSL